MKKGWKLFWTFFDSSDILMSDTPLKPIIKLFGIKKDIANFSGYPVPRRTSADNMPVARELTNTPNPIAVDNC